MPYARTTAALAIVLGTIAFLVTQPLAGQQPAQTAAQSPYFAGQAAAFPSTTAPAPVAYPGYAPAVATTATNDPELSKVLVEEAKLDQEANSIIEEYAKTEDEGQRSKLKSKLSAALEKQFDLQQKRRELEVTRIENQLKKLRELMRKRSDARQAIVDKRLDQLVREAEGLGWTTPGAPRRATTSSSSTLFAPTASPVSR